MFSIEKKKIVTENARLFKQTVFFFFSQNLFFFFARSIELQDYRVYISSGNKKNKLVGLHISCNKILTQLIQKSSRNGYYFFSFFFFFCEAVNKEVTLKKKKITKKQLQHTQRVVK